MRSAAIAVIERIRRHPAAIAITDADGALNYGELGERSAAVAAALAAHGVRSGDVVGVAVTADRYLPAVLLGVWRTGAAYLVTDRPLTGAGIRAVVGPGGIQSTVDSTGEPSAAGVACRLRTSGSTGPPRTVPLRHDVLAAQLAGVAQALTVRPDDVVSAAAPPYLGVSTVEIWLPLSTGARLTYRPDDPGTSVLFATPTTLRAMVANGFSGRLGLRVVSTGEPADPALVPAIAGEHWNLYGPVEAGPVTRLARLTDGTLPAGPDLYVVDAYGTPAAEGELWISRPGPAAGAFVPDPFVDGRCCLRTGDRARRRDDGAIEFLDPAGAIEARLRTVPGVVDATVALDGAGRTAYVVAAPDHEPEPERLRDVLPPPARVVTVTALPTRAGGRRDRSARPAPPAPPPRTAAVTALVRSVWAQVLGVDGGALDGGDDFFALGGHSLSATRVVRRLMDETGAALTAGVLFTRPTLSAFTAAVAAAGADRITPGPASGRLSAAQRQMWLLWRADPDDPAYVVPLILRLRGPVDPVALTTAVRTLAQRHQVLRSIVRDTPDGPRIEVLPATSVPVTTTAGDWVAEPPRPFRLDREPPLRAVLHRVAAQEYVLAMELHHIAVDERSVELIGAELTALYRDPAVAAPTLQYADVAAWEQAQPIDRDVDWWADTLAGAPLTLDLSADRPPAPPALDPAPGRPARTGRSATEVPVAFDGPAVTRLRELARTSGGSPFMVLLAAWLAVLGELSGAGRPAVAVTHRGRLHPDAESVIGYFINPLIIDADLTGRPTGTALLAQVQARVSAAIAHAAAPYERVVARLGPAVAPASVLVNVVDAAGPALAIPGVRTTEVRVPATAARFDLQLDLTDAGAQISGGLIYRESRFDRRTAVMIADAYRAGLLALLADPDRRVDETDLVPAAGHDELRSLGTGPALPATRTTVVAAIDHQARTRPAAVAVIGTAGRLDYAGLDALSARVAGGLIAAGVRPGDVVAAGLDRDHTAPAVLLGIWRAGAAYLPLDPVDPPARRTEVVADARARLVVGAGGTPVATLTEAPPAATRSPELDDLAYVIYTSGSTGRPKGVEVTHGNLSAFLAGAGPRPRTAEMILGMIPFVFDVSMVELWGTLATGGTLALATGDTVRDGHALARWIDRHRCRVISGTPTALRGLVAAGWPGDPAARIVCGGEVLDTGLAGELLARAGEVWNIYGPTEATVWATETRVVPGPDTLTIPIGRPLPGVRLRVLDRYGHHPVPRGVIGELWIGGSGVARGYRYRPDLTAAAFVRDPATGERRYRTGDLVRWNAAGQLEFHGRRDGQVKVRGYRIELAEIEAVLGTHPDVAAAAVTVTTGPAGDRLTGYVVPRDRYDPADLERHLRERLPAHFVPRDWHRLGVLPTTGTGKVDRAALRSTASAPAAAAAAPATAPATDMEKFVAYVWTDVLGVPDPAADDDFFALGGHSFEATRVSGALTEAVCHDVPVRLVFEHPVLRDLAAAVESIALDQLAAEEVVTAGPERG